MNLSNPLVSICCITYNHENFIRQALDGFLMQKTSFPIEIIIHDDASTDNTANIIREYQAKHPHLIKPILQTENQYSQGKKVFPITFKETQGKYISPCEGDDYWTDPLKLQKQVDFLEANPDFAICFHNSKIEDHKSREYKEWIMHKNLEKSVFETKDILCQWFIPTASILFRKYDDFVFPEWYQHCDSGDIVLLLLLSLRGKFKYINEVMSVYRLHDQGISNTHIGYKKVIAMAFIYQNFNIYTNYKYHHEIMDAIVYEFHTHLPEIRELKNMQLTLETLPMSFIIYALKQKIVNNFNKKIKSIFSISNSISLSNK
jgi:glycosyltransferase involved in cell wall biosynthesis